MSTAASSVPPLPVEHSEHLIHIHVSSSNPELLKNKLNYTKIKSVTVILYFKSIFHRYEFSRSCSSSTIRKNYQAL